MLTQWAGLAPVDVAEFLAVIAFLTSAILVLSDSYSRSAIRSNWQFLSVCLLILVAFRIPLHAFFHGTEYEDSYVYGASEREPQISNNSVGSPYLVSTCTIGSIQSCESWQTFSGHYIGYTSVLRLASRWLGDTPATSNWVNLLASCVAVLTVFLICGLIGSERLTAVAACLMFASTPVFAIYGMASFSEPLSNACLAIALYCYLRFIHFGHANRRLQMLNWVALTATLLFAITVKRENVLLAVGLPIGTILVLNLGRTVEKLDAHNLKLALLSCTVVVLFCAVELQYARSLQKEVSEFGGFPFGIANFKELGPAFVKSFFLPEWYSFTVLLVAVGVVATFLKRGLTVIPSLLLVMYWGLYTTHVRSYYQLHGGHVSPNEAFRYSMNLISLWSIVAGFGLAQIVNHRLGLLNERRRVLIACAFVYILVCYVVVRKLQNGAESEEWAIRINPAMTAAKYANDLGTSDTFIVTPEPLVIQMFAPKNVNIISLDRIDTGALRSLQTNHPNLKLLYLKYSSYAERQASSRYSREMECLDEMIQGDLYSDSHFALMQIEVPTGDRLKCAD
jgi:hypothetical protein